MNLRLLGIRLSLLLLCSFFYGHIYGAVFTVTSNADSGPGTLREALTLAAANGNVAADFIYFNMPGPSPEDHTIKIITELPTITTDLIIDASTQPGPEAAINGAKVIIDGRQFAYDPMLTQTLFRFINVNRFELYGLIIRNFIDFDLDTGDYPVYMTLLDFYGINQKVVLGAPGKGNVIYNAGGMYCHEDSRITRKPQIREIIMKANLFGVKENGIDIATEVIPLFYLLRTYKAEIGGPTPEEGNVMYARFQIGYAEENETIAENIICNIRNNTFTANKNGDNQGIADKFSTLGLALSLNANSINTGPAKFNVMDNVFGSIFSIGGFNNADVTISRNFFGTSRDKSTNLTLVGTALFVSRIRGRVLVGGSTTAEGNIIVYFNKSIHSISDQTSQQLTTGSSKN